MEVIFADQKLFSRFLIILLIMMLFMIAIMAMLGIQVSDLKALVQIIVSKFS